MRNWPLGTIVKYRDESGYWQGVITEQAHPLPNGKVNSFEVTFDDGRSDWFDLGVLQFDIIANSHWSQYSFSSAE